MKTIAFSIQKGGTGISTIAGNVGWISAQSGIKTLLVDGDPQGSLSSWLITDQPKWELADVLQERVGLAGAVHPLTKKLDIVPTFGIGGGLKTFAENGLEGCPRCLEELKDSALNLDYKMLIFDASPGLGRLERMFMLAADEIITPLSCEYFGLDALEILGEPIKQTMTRFG